MLLLHRGVISKCWWQQVGKSGQGSLDIVHVVVAIGVAVLVSGVVGAVAVAIVGAQVAHAIRVPIASTCKRKLASTSFRRSSGVRG